jgi:Exo-beta-D-glucosaminidase Ig-fold domain
VFPYCNDVALVVLDLMENNGSVLSHNVYWLAQRSEILRALDTLPTVTLKAFAIVHPTAEGHVVWVQLTNSSDVVSMATKLTLLNESTKQRILPAYYSDNYVTLLPGEIRTIEIEVPDGKAEMKFSVAPRGWNKLRRPHSWVSGLRSISAVPEKIHSILV